MDFEDCLKTMAREGGLRSVPDDGRATARKV